MHRFLAQRLAVVVLTALLGGTGAMAENKHTETATFGGGCFWCLEAVFEQLQGVESVISGYAGGNGPAVYQEVCAGTTGHAEVVQITYDPSVITYRDLLTVFFATHDPTTLDRQGADVGSQYRSVVFYHDDKQKADAKAAFDELVAQKVWPNPIVTQLAKNTGFYPAEDHHQNYYDNNKSQGYCQAVINPKLKKFRQKFADKLKN